jgi:hypothetical protein
MKNEIFEKFVVLTNKNKYNNLSKNNCIINLLYKNKSKFFYKKQNVYIVTLETFNKSNFNFNIFRKSYSFYKKSDFLEDDNWLVWFIGFSAPSFRDGDEKPSLQRYGFSEGDGAILEYKQRLTFVLTQKDSKLLYDVRKTLGFGVVKNFKTYSRFIVSNNTDCFLLFLIFNGNLVLNNRIKQLVKWHNVFLVAKKLYHLKNFNLIQIPNVNLKPIKPSLKDSWLSGFTDAEGCFSITINEMKCLVRSRFILDQKEGEYLLKHICNLFNYGNVNLRSNTNKVYRLTVSMNKSKEKHYIKFINYFNKYPLKTNKFLNYQIWCKINNLVALKLHKTNEGFKNIKELRSRLNKKIHKINKSS